MTFEEPGPRMTIQQSTTCEPEHNILSFADATELVKHTIYYNAWGMARGVVGGVQTELQR